MERLLLEMNPETLKQALRAKGPFKVGPLLRSIQKEWSDDIELKELASSIEQSCRTKLGMLPLNNDTNASVEMQIARSTRLYPCLFSGLYLPSIVSSMTKHLNLFSIRKIKQVVNVMFCLDCMCEHFVSSSRRPCLQ